LLRDEWALLSDKEDQPKRRRLIEVALGLAEKDGGGAAKGLQEFNCFYGARPRPSVEYIQSPATWHLADLTVSLPQDQEFVAACKLKWAFRIKPDLVITAGNRVLCIEAKWESAESRYPTAASERRVFKERGLPETVVSQTELQRYLLSDLLGFDTHFVFLTKATSLGPESLTWRQAFSGLDLDTAGVPAFIYKWVDALD
jgi:hypothetical protein